MEGDGVFERREGSFTATRGDGMAAELLDWMEDADEGRRRGMFDS